MDACDFSEKEQKRAKKSKIFENLDKNVQNLNVRLCPALCILKNTNVYTHKHTHTHTYEQETSVCMCCIVTIKQKTQILTNFHILLILSHVCE